MKKELGKWLLDLAKYMLTAGIIAPWIADSGLGMSNTTIPLVLAAVFCFTLGLYFIRMQEQREEKREKNRNKKRR